MRYVFGGLTVSRINVSTADRVGAQLVDLHAASEEDQREVDGVVELVDDGLEALGEIIQLVGGEVLVDQEYEALGERLRRGREVLEERVLDDYVDRSARE